MRAIVLTMIAAALLGLAVLAANMLVLSTPAAAAAPASSDLVWRSGTYVLRLTGEPCAVPDLAGPLEEEGIPPARKFIATQPGRQSSGCWAKDIMGDILARDLAGSMGDLPIPIEWFERDPGV